VANGLLGGDFGEWIARHAARRNNDGLTSQRPVTKTRTTIDFSFDGIFLTNLGYHNVQQAAGRRSAQHEAEIQISTSNNRLAQPNGLGEFVCIGFHSRGGSE
jgi:hypothetical protein